MGMKDGGATLDGRAGVVSQVFDKANLYKLLATSTQRLATCWVLYQPYSSCRLMYATRMAGLLSLGTPRCRCMSSVRPLITPVAVREEIASGHARLGGRERRVNVVDGRESVCVFLLQWCERDWVERRHVQECRSKLKSQGSRLALEVATSYSTSKI